MIIYNSFDENMKKETIYELKKSLLYEEALIESNFIKRNHLINVDIE